MGQVLTYISSISAGVRRATSGRMNQAITTETKPVAAKLQHRSNVSIFSTISSELEEKAHLQETCLDTPTRFGKGPVDHKGRGEAEHNGNEVRRSEGPSRSPCAQALLGSLSRVGIADC
jgi:hypothetical protein